MLSIFDPFRDITTLSIILRLFLAFVCGGAVGLERTYKRRPAGFRTHILICLGAAMTTLTSQYLYLHMHYFTDVARLGAQVIAGIGFIGAGTIIVTRRQQVKGLTTAAGLWVSAIVGLCLGAGFYEGAIITTCVILCTELLFSKWEYKVLDRIPQINLYMEYTDQTCLDRVLRYFHKQDLKVLNMEITRSEEPTAHHTCVIFSLRLPRRCSVRQILEDVSQTKGVVFAEEL